MVGLLSNFYAANTLSPLIFLIYYLLTPIFHPCCPSLQPSWAMIHAQLSGAGCLSVLSFSGLSLLLSWHGCSVFFLPSIPLPRKSKIQPLAHFLAIGHCQLYLPIRTKLGPGPTVSYRQDSHAIWELIMQALNKIHSTLSYLFFSGVVSLRRQRTTRVIAGSLQ